MYIFAQKCLSIENILYLCNSIMETEIKTIEELIADVLDDINQKGFSSVQPFSIGNVELRILITRWRWAEKWLNLYRL